MKEWLNQRGSLLKGVGGKGRKKNDELEGKTRDLSLRSLERRKGANLLGEENKRAKISFP